MWEDVYTSRQPAEAQARLWRFIKRQNTDILCVRTNVHETIESGEAPKTSKFFYVIDVGPSIVFCNVIRSVTVHYCALQSCRRGYKCIHCNRPFPSLVQKRRHQIVCPQKRIAPRITWVTLAPFNSRWLVSRLVTQACSSSSAVKPRALDVSKSLKVQLYSFRMF